MYKYIILCLCVSLNSVLCDLNQEEGSSCEWDGVQGKCVKETQCMTTLDTRSDKHPVCSTKGDVTIVCCTDCELVNDTRNVVMSPTTGFYWKDGTKARDSCLQYLDDLPYRCRDGGFYSGIKRHYNETKKCHGISLWAIGGSPPPGSKPGAKYPHQARLGYGNDLETAQWSAGGAIISNKYILTAAHAKQTPSLGALKFIALDVEQNLDSPTAWQIHTVKRFIEHPDYKSGSYYHDIALIETETPITFNKNVLPACLQVEAVDDKEAVATTWRNQKSESTTESAHVTNEINSEKISEEDCKTAYEPNRRLRDGIDFNTQMCYVSKSEDIVGLSGEPLLVTTQFSRCIYTIIGVTTFGRHGKPDVYTRVAYYKPWIESVVWA